MTEMHFRQYDAAIGRFTGIHKLSEEFFSMTPYNFAGNNPISYMDPSGLKLIAPTKPPYVPGGSVGNLSGIYGNHEHGYLDNLKAMAGGGGGGPGGTGWGFGTGYSNSYQAYQQETSGGYWESSDISGFIDPVTGRMSVELTVTQTWIDTFQQSMDDFMWGVFFPKEKSNFLSISAFTGYAALYLSKIEKLVQLALLGQSSNVINSYDGFFNGAKTIGRKLGYIAIKATITEDIINGNAGIGTAAKVGIGLLTIVFPVAGLIYAAVDLGVGIYQGTTLTDRIASGVENAYNN